LWKLRRLWYTRHRKVVAEPAFCYEYAVRYLDVIVCTRSALLVEREDILKMNRKNSYQKGFGGRMTDYDSLFYRSGVPS